MLFRSLAAKNNDGWPGFYLAMQNNHADAIREFGDLLRFIPNPNVRAELLAAKKTNGTPGFYIAMQENNADAIHAFGELLNLIPANRRFDLLCAKRAGYTALQKSMDKGDLATLRAYGRSLKFISGGECAELLAAKDDDGHSWFSNDVRKNAMTEKRVRNFAVMVQAALPVLNPENRQALLTALTKGLIERDEQGDELQSNEYQDFKAHFPAAFAECEKLRELLTNPSA